MARALILILLFLCCPRTTLASGVNWYLASDGELPFLGQGFDSLLEKTKANLCVEGKIKSIQVGSSGSFSITRNMQESQLLEGMSAFLEVKIPVFPFITGKGRGEFATESSHNELRDNIVVMVKFLAKMDSIPFQLPNNFRPAESVKGRFKDWLREFPVGAEPEESLKKISGKLGKMCGDQFVDQIVYGYSLIVAVTFEYKDMVSKLAIGASIAADIGVGPIQLEDVVKVVSKFTEDKTKHDISIKMNIWAEGSIPGQILQSAMDSPYLNCSTPTPDSVTKGVSCADIFNKIALLLEKKDKLETMEYLKPVLFSGRRYPRVPPSDLMNALSSLGKKVTEEERTILRAKFQDPLVKAYELVREKRTRLGIMKKLEIPGTDFIQSHKLLDQLEKRITKTWSECWLKSVSLNVSDEELEAENLKGKKETCLEKIKKISDDSENLPEFNRPYQWRLDHWFKISNLVSLYLDTADFKSNTWEGSTIPQVEAFETIKSNLCTKDYNQESSEDCKRKKCKEGEAEVLCQEKIKNCQNKKCQRFLIETVDLKMNKKGLKTAIPFQSLRKLKTLNLANNFIQDGLRNLLELRNLETLDLSKNDIRNIFELSDSPFSKNNPNSKLVLDDNQVEDLGKFLKNPKNSWKNVSLKNTNIPSLKEEIPQTPVKCLDLRGSGVEDLSGLKDLRSENFKLILDPVRSDKCPFEKNNSKGNGCFYEGEC